MLNLRSILIFAAAMRIALSFALDRVTYRRQKRDLRTDRVKCYSLGLEPWSTWTPCYSDKGTFRQIRWRSRKGFSFKSNKCSKRWEERDCELPDISTYVEKPTRCDLSAWTEWGDCRRGFGGLYRERHRVPQSSPEGSFKCSEIQHYKLAQYEECENDCAWASWSTCFSYDPSAPYPHYERYRKKESKLHKNLLCAGKWFEREDCHYCEWSAWRDWTNCYEFMGDFERIRERSRVISDNLNGQPCSMLADNDAQEYQRCSLPSSGPKTTSTILGIQSDHTLITPSATYAIFTDDSG